MRPGHEHLLVLASTAELALKHEVFHIVAVVINLELIEDVRVERGLEPLAGRNQPVDVHHEHDVGRVRRIRKNENVGQVGSKPVDILGGVGVVGGSEWSREARHCDKRCCREDEAAGFHCV